MTGDFVRRCGTTSVASTLRRVRRTHQRFNPAFYPSRFSNALLDPADDGGRPPGVGLDPRPPGAASEGDPRVQRQLSFLLHWQIQSSKGCYCFKHDGSFSLLRRWRTITGGGPGPARSSACKRRRSTCAATAVVLAQETNPVPLTP